MKPRTEREKTCCKWANSLPAPTDALRRHAESLLKPYAYRWRHRGNRVEMWCQNCGHSEILPKDKAQWLDQSFFGWICPECGQEMEVKDYKRRWSLTSEEQITVQVAVVNGIQCLRAYLVSRTNRHGEPTVRELREVFQIWVFENGVQVITSRPYWRTCCNMTWDHEKPYWIGRHNGGGSGYYCYDDLYDLSFYCFYPRIRLAGYLKRISVDNDEVRSWWEGRKDTATAMKARLRDPRLETLKKLGTDYRNILLHFTSTSPLRVLGDFWPSIRICIRNRYPISDASLWLDHVSMLKEDGKDILNAHYVCPADLLKEHDALTKRITHKRENDRLRHQYEEDRQHNEQYVRRCGALLGFRADRGDISIAPLQDIWDFKVEGEELHHCVFAMRYYDKEDCLILGVRVNGNRTETVEVDTKRWQVVQCRGKFNHPSQRHDEILTLVQESLGELKRLSSSAAK